MRKRKTRTDTGGHRHHPGSPGSSCVADRAPPGPPVTTASPFYFGLGWSKLGFCQLGLRVPPNIFTTPEEESLRLTLGTCDLHNVRPASPSGLGLPYACPALHHLQRIFPSTTTQASDKEASVLSAVSGVTQA